MPQLKQTIPFGLSHGDALWQGDRLLLPCALEIRGCAFSW